MEDCGCEGARGQVRAAEDDGEMKWLEDEKIQYLLTDKKNAAEYGFPGLKMSLDLRLSERAGAAVDGEVVPQHHQGP